MAPSATKLVLPITGGSSSEPAKKKQKKEAQRRVQHVGVRRPFIKSKWSHIPITFSQDDLQLKDYPHNDAMVISCVIKGFLFIMSLQTQVVQKISSLQKPSGRCKNRMIRYMMQHSPCVASEEVGSGTWKDNNANHIRLDRKSTRLNSSHITRSRMPSSA